MTCEDYRDLLVALDDNELSESEETLLKKHLEECNECSKELNEIRQFKQQIHKTTVPFRESAQRISAPQTIKHRSSRLPAWAAVAAAFILIASFWYYKSSGPDVDQLASWGIQHYALVEQTHPVTGDATTVSEWFQQHHHISIKPPERINYARLSGCKFTEMNSMPVALLRVEEEPVRAVFILPQKSALLLQKKVLYKDGYQIEFWKEDGTLYMSMRAQIRSGIGQLKQMI
jgi:anti-sigma factor RsiW